MPIGGRLAISAALLLMLAGGSVMAYIFGMLMFAFSGDAATPGSYPDWIEPAMLLGWPITMGLATIVPPIIVLVWPRWWVAVPSILFSFALPVVFYLAC